MLGHEGRLHHDILAAGSAQAGYEPSVVDLVVAARHEEEPWSLLLGKAGQDRPLPGVAPA